MAQLKQRVTGKADSDWISLTQEQASAFIPCTNPAAYLNCSGELKTSRLYIVGENDGPHPATMEEMASLTPGARLIRLKDAAHLANLEQPAAFN